jgi:hypothetical protein
LLSRGAGLALGPVLLAVTVAPTVAGCGEDGDRSGDLAPRVRAALAADPDAVADRLAEQGVDAEPADVTDLDLTCPAVRSPEPGDRATCTGAVDGTAIAVDVEFGEGEELTVVVVEVLP